MFFVHVTPDLKDDRSSVKVTGVNNLSIIIIIKFISDKKSIYTYIKYNKKIRKVQYI